VTYLGELEDGVVGPDDSVDKDCMEEGVSWWQMRMEKEFDPCNMAPTRAN
jgi:hypothetical protein